ncbi:ricin-type beta-trefoil lectin domain protein [Actinocrispum wychmicini]|uniref:Alpha-galactosidase n=1 Tax=Actinocrispum wychmicini TaxID=1213861 RepID=A0A4V2S7G7_9PSEU|nr:ricin-type beta-trefoil lectin domain protein [Actinocrispum wychmicini]TCO59830.1 alpha-galactosidase [Actinocrispum wychmicini]
MTLSRRLAILPLVAASLLVAPAAQAADNGDNLAVTPPMGFNNWARYECGLSESVLTRNADALVSTGLAAKGYRTVTVDDCWMTHSRDAAGNLVADPAKFPHGMKWLGDYLHTRNLKFGIYEDAGTSTCGGFPGSLGHFTADAKLFASWGVDYLKLDGCNVPVPQGRTKEQAYRDLYAQQSAALGASGRRIVFSESAPAYFCCQNADWYRTLSWLPQYGQLWREGWDVAVHGSANKWASLMTNYSYNVPLQRYAGPNHWNDPDFLITGDEITAEESRTQVALWSMMAAPLILSTDVAALSSESVAAAGNTGLIAIDQDSLGRQAARVATSGTSEVLVKPLANGDRAVAFLNRGSASATVSTSTLGFTGTCSLSVTNVWTGTTSQSTGTITASVPAHGTAVFRITPGAGCSVVPTGQIDGIGGKCVDDTNSGTADGTQIALFSCSGNANQRWALSTDGTIRTLGKCLTAAGTADGSAVQLGTCSGSSAQRWTYQQAGNLVNTASGKCLDASGGSSADLTKLIVWPCGQFQVNQTWSLPV